MFSFLNRKPKDCLRLKTQSARRVQAYLIGEQISTTLTLLNAANKAMLNQFEPQSIKEWAVIQRNLSVTLDKLIEARERIVRR